MEHQLSEINTLIPSNFHRVSVRSRLLLGDKDKGQLTIGKVNVLGDLVPGPVVKVADLLLVLHHVGWFSSFLVLHCYVVLDCLKILPMLETRTVEMSTSFEKIHIETF